MHRVAALYSLNVACCGATSWCAEAKKLQLSSHMVTCSIMSPSISSLLLDQGPLLRHSLRIVLSGSKPSSQCGPRPQSNGRVDDEFRNGLLRVFREERASPFLKDPSRNKCIGTREQKSTFRTVCAAPTISPMVRGTRPRTLERNKRGPKNKRGQENGDTQDSRGNHIKPRAPEGTRHSFNEQRRHQ